MALMPAPAPAKPAPPLSGRLRRAYGSCPHLLFLLVPLRLERAAGRGEERRLERVHAVALLDLVRGLEAEQLAVVEDPDPLGEDLRLDEVVGAKQDCRVVDRPYLADEVLDLELRPRVEP